MTKNFNLPPGEAEPECQPTKEEEEQSLGEELDRIYERRKDREIQQMIERKYGR